MATYPCLLSLPRRSDWQGWCLPYGGLLSSLGLTNISVLWLYSCLSCSASFAVSGCWNNYPSPVLGPFLYICPLILSHGFQQHAPTHSHHHSHPFPGLTQHLRIKQASDHAWWKNTLPILQSFSVSAFITWPSPVPITAKSHRLFVVVFKFREHTSCHRTLCYRFPSLFLGASSSSLHMTTSFQTFPFPVLPEILA